MLPYILIFFAIYLPVFRILGMMVDTQAVFFIGIIISMVAFGGSRAIFLKRNSTWFMLILFGLVCYGLVTGLAISSNAVSHVALRPIRALLTLIGCYSLLFVISKIKRQDIITLPLDKYIFFSIVAHSLIMIAQFIFPEFRNAIYSYTVDLERVIGQRLNYSMAGLTNGGGAQLSVYQSIGVLLLPLVLEKTSTLKSKIFFILCGFACLVSVLLSGRSGILGIFVFFPVVLFFIGMNKFSRKKILLSSIFYGLILMVALFLFTWDPTSALKNVTSEGFESLILRTTALFRGEDSTVQELWYNHILFPDDIQVAILGDPRLIELDQSNSSRILASDIGYVRVLFGYGLLGSILHYLFYIGVITLSVSVYKQRSPYRKYAAFSIVVAILILFFNSKEVFVFTRIGFSIVSLSVFLLACQKNHLKRYEYSLNEVSSKIINPPLTTMDHQIN